MKGPATGHVERDVQIPVTHTHLRGSLAIPADAAGLVLFAHGSGSGSRSPRNEKVAAALREAGLGTLLFDLLTEDEDERDRAFGGYRFNIDLLARRLAAATAWVVDQPGAGGLPIGYFGASTGAAAAIHAAAAHPSLVRAIVSRGGRPDLAGKALERLVAPTLLIVGGADGAVIRMNQDALHVIRAPKRLEIVPGAGHRFEEPGALERVAQLASGWFLEHSTNRPEGTSVAELSGATK